MEENTPLLTTQSHRSPSLRPVPCLSTRQARTIYRLLSLLIFSIVFAGTVAEVPLTRLLEDSICRRHYAHVSEGDIDEARCKIEAVQSKLVYLNGWLAMMEAAVGLFVAFPYGAYADKRGRKPVLWLSLAGVVLAAAWVAAVLALGQRVSIYAVLVSPALLVVGGGGTVLIATVYAVAADVASEADRASAFLTMTVGFLMGEMLAPLAASSLMDAMSAWAPVALSITISFLSMSILFFIPETLPAEERDSQREPHTSKSLLGVASHCLKNFTSQIADAMGVLEQPSLRAILFAFLCPFAVALATSTLLAQYVSRRFQWSLAAAGYLLSIKGMVNILVVLVVIPGVSKLLMSGTLGRGYSAGAKDRLLACLSAAALAIGFLLIAGPSMPIVIIGLTVKTLGAAFPALCRSLATSHVSPLNGSKLQTVIGITETVGLMVAAPALAWLFSAGMKMGGIWAGLPFLAMSAHLAIAAAALCFVKLPAASSPTDASERHHTQDAGPDVATSIPSVPLHATLPTHAPVGHAGSVVLHV